VVDYKRLKISGTLEKVEESAKGIESLVREGTAEIKYSKLKKPGLFNRSAGYECLIKVSEGVNLPLSGVNIEQYFEEQKEVSKEQKQIQGNILMYSFSTEESCSEEIGSIKHFIKKTQTPKKVKVDRKRSSRTGSDGWTIESSYKDAYIIQGPEESVLYLKELIENNPFGIKINNSKIIGLKKPEEGKNPNSLND
jgi:hypothetical protein